MSRFFIKQISVTGEKVLFSEVSFNDGVNIIYGPSNAGKSYIINCINFMFAGDPPFTKSSTGYDTVTMTMESDDGYAISMTRKIIDGKNGEVGENSVEVISNYPNVESGPYSISKNEYSDLLLKLMGINEHHKIISTEGFDSQSLGIRTLIHFFFIGEEHIFGKRTVLDSPSYSKINAYLCALNFLLTGDDSMHLMPEETKEERERRITERTGVIAYLNQKIEELSQRKAELEAREAVGETDAEGRIEELLSAIEEIENEIGTASSENRELVRERYEISTKIEEALFLKDRYRVLKSQYEADILRLQFICDGERKEDTIDEAVACPFCNHEIEKGTVAHDDQGLYRFRGATIRNILEFPDHFIDGKCKRVDLTINYRSEKEIIDFYNDWMTSTDEKFVWKNFRFPKKIVPGKKDYSSDTRVVKCSGKNGVEDWYDSVYDFVISLKHQGVIKDYNQVAFLCKSVKNDKVINLIQYLEAMNIPVYSPRSEMFFTRPEVKEILGCLIMCFPNYFLRLKTESFTYSYPDLYRYYREECVEAAQKLIKAHKDLKKWYENILRNHSQLKSNTDYAFTGILYQLLEFEPFRGYVGIDIGSGVTDERAARNISILSAVLGKYEYLHRVEVFSEKNIISAPEIFFNMYMRFLFEGGITEYEDDSEYAPSGCISFMTIHQSKGMEFPVVMVDSLSAVPRTQSDGVIEEIEKKYFHRPAFEAKEDIKFFDFWRLYYTAFSRAQNLLVLSCYEKNGIGRTPSKYFESCYSTLPSYNDIDLSKMESLLWKSM